jgi:ribonuclease E
MAGAFEIDRVGHRNPEDFPRAQTQAPAPLSAEDQADLDVVEEAELEEEDEVIEEAAAEAEAEAQPGEERAPREPREGGDDRNGRRGRRRRGGRNRSRSGRDREPREGGAPREQTQANGEQPVAAEGGDGEFVAGPEDMAEGGEQFASEHGPENGTNDQQRQDGDGRRRRRRRGRRGGHRDRVQNGDQHPMAAPADGAEAAPHTDNGGESPAIAPPVSQTPASFGSDRYGHVDEIDTTPTDAPVRSVPNAASAPSWSLNDPHEIDTTPTDEPKSNEPAAPPKKGWWQRAFKS